ncbi:MAG: 2-dehydropantoate 2-reductase N-terminal domain-containing protein [Polyangiaceae bacterium]
MRVRILGAGAIGTTFAHRLARAGAQVTLVARGARLEGLRRAAGAIVTRDGLEARVAVSAEVDEPSISDDALIVAVRAQSLDGALPIAARSRAPLVAFAVNAVGPVDAARRAVGASRGAWIFPAIVASLDEDGILDAHVVPRALSFAQITTVGTLGADEPSGLSELEASLEAAGVPTARAHDIEAWLTTHAAFMAPLMAAGALAGPSGLAGGDAQLVARAMHAGLVVAREGFAIEPATLEVVARTPVPLLARTVATAFRLPATRRALSAEENRAEAEALLAALAELGHGSAVGDLDALRARLDL